MDVIIFDTLPASLQEELAHRAELEAQWHEQAEREAIEVERNAEQYADHSCEPWA
jgi:hypothetical protein